MKLHLSPHKYSIDYNLKEQNCHRPKVIGLSSFTGGQSIFFTKIVLSAETYRRRKINLSLHLGLGYSYISFILTQSWIYFRHKYYKYITNTFENVQKMKATRNFTRFAFSFAAVSENSACQRLYHYVIT